MKLPTNIITKIGAFFLLTATLLLSPVGVKALEPVTTTVGLIIFAGKVYSLSSRVVSGATAVAKIKITQLTAEESERTIKSFLDSIDGRIDAAGRESYAAKDQEGSRKALNKKAALIDLKNDYAR